jgi:hypothetical protein
MAPQMGSRQPHVELGHLGRIVRKLRRGDLSGADAAQRMACGVEID